MMLDESLLMLTMDLSGEVRKFLILSQQQRSRNTWVHLWYSLVMWYALLTSPRGCGGVV